MSSVGFSLSGPNPATQAQLTANEQKAITTGELTRVPGRENYRSNTPRNSTDQSQSSPQFFQSKKD